MAPVVATKFCLRSKFPENPTKHSQNNLCGDCGAPPYVPKDSDSAEEAPPTSEYIVGAADGAPHHPTIREPATILIPPHNIQYPQPSLISMPQGPIKRVPQINAHRRKDKKNKGTPAAQLLVDQASLQQQWVQQMEMIAQIRQETTPATSVHASKDQFHLNGDPLARFAVVSFLVKVCRITYSTPRGRAIYNNIDGPIKVVNFHHEDQVDLTWATFTRRLVNGARVIERGILTQTELDEGRWDTSMNHLGGRVVCDISPEYWIGTLTLKEVLLYNKWPQQSDTLSFNATVIY
jgi:hypothetical protein